MRTKPLLTVIFLIAATITAFGQTTEFTYQGQLQNSSTPATGVFDFEFVLFDTAFGGAQIGSTNTRSGVSVASGIFSVNLDFGQSFPGGTRFLEIRVRQSGGGSFTALSPRQPVSSAPYSIKSLNASNADNAANATNAVNSTNAVNLTGPLAGDVTGTQSSTTVARLRGTNVAPTVPTNNQVLKFNSANSQWEPATDETGGGGGGGTITGVTAGTGLTGGGTTGTVAVGIANGGVGTLQLADGSVTDPKIVGVSGAKVTGAVANATNATQLGGIAANQYVQTNDQRLTDARAPTSGSSNYIQNIIGPPSQNPANFNINGTGTANVLNAATQYNLFGIRILSATGSENLFAGIGAGMANTSGSANSFFGRDAGLSNTGGIQNSFFGSNAGQANINGVSNAFFGTSAGSLSTATGNSFFGALAGLVTTTGGNNSFFGRNSGISNTTPSNNSFFGAFAGASNTTGADNAFFGSSAGDSTTTGESNSFFGYQAGETNLVGSFNSYFGRSAGENSTAINNTMVGYVAGQATTTGGGNTFVGRGAGDSNTTGSSNTAIGIGANVGSNNLTFATAIGAAAVVSTSSTIALGRSTGADTVRIPGELVVTGGGDAEPSGGGAIIAGLTTATNVVIDNNEIMARSNGAVSTLAINADGGNVNLIQSGTGSVGIGTSSPDQKLSVNGNASKTGGASWAVFSDERLKNISGQFSVGLDAIRRLNPIRFEYKKDNALGLAYTGEQIGFSAQEVQKIIPEAVTTSRDGYLQLNVDPILWTMLNGIKEQQNELETLRSHVRDQTLVISALKKALCDLSPTAVICRK